MVFNCKYCIYQYLTARNILMAKPITRIVSVNHSQKGENEVHSMFFFFCFLYFSWLFQAVQQLHSAFARIPLFAADSMKLHVSNRSSEIARFELLIWCFLIAREKAT